MTAANYETMGLDELRQYVLTHRENVQAFHVYVDRSKRVFEKSNLLRLNPRKSP
jgi:hypothetical protein